MLIKLRPYMIDKIWGGSYFRDTLAYNSTDSCGEAWGFSGIPGKASVVVGGPYDGLNMSQLYSNHHELFGNYKSDYFPILIKLIDANQDLSVQVHPDNEYAKIHDNSLGKTECWYVLNCERDSSIVIGHKAVTLDEFRNSIVYNTLDNIICRKPIEKDMVFDIPAGMIHAICEGTVILEVQQSSDITYRLFDYGRLENGKPRTLHLDDALNVISIPSKKVEHSGKSEYFEMKIINNFEGQFFSDRFGDYLYIISGNGTVDGVQVLVGEFLFLTSDSMYNVKGKLKVAQITMK